MPWLLTCWRLRTLRWQFAAHLTLCGLETVAPPTAQKGNPFSPSRFESCIMYDMIGVFVAASSGIMALNFFLCGSAVKGRSVCHWFIGFQYLQTKSCCEYTRGLPRQSKARNGREGGWGKISFKVVLLNLAYITGMLMQGSPRGACLGKSWQQKCRSLSHGIWVKFAANVVAHSCIIKQVTSYTQVTKGNKETTRRASRAKKTNRCRDTVFSARGFVLTDRGGEGREGDYELTVGGAFEVSRCHRPQATAAISQLSSLMPNKLPTIDIIYVKFEPV